MTYRISWQSCAENAALVTLIYEEHDVFFASKKYVPDDVPNFSAVVLNYGRLPHCLSSGLSSISQLTM